MVPGGSSNTPTSSKLTDRLRGSQRLDSDSALGHGDCLR